MNGTQIALIDDSDEDAYVIARAFRPAEIQHFSTARSLLDAVSNNPALLQRFDLLLVDLNLSGEDGVDIVRAVRASPQNPDIPVVMLTGSHAEPDILRALDAGVTEYEVKPDDIEGLNALVQRCTALARRSR